MKSIGFIVAVFVAGYLAFHFSPAGKRAQGRMQKSAAQHSAPRADPKFAGKTKDELQFELQFTEEVVAAIKKSADQKPVVVPACGMTRTTTITPEMRSQLAEYEADIRSLRIAIAAR
jgi:cytochrome c556